MIEEMIVGFLRTVVYEVWFNGGGSHVVSMDMDTGKWMMRGPIYQMDKKSDWLRRLCTDMGVDYDSIVALQS